MDLGESVRMSLRAIRSHRLRSGLTTLGVIIGVAAVITFVTLGASLEADILGTVGEAEATQITVWAGPEGQGRGPGFGAQPVFTRTDVDRLEGLEGVAAVVPRGSVPVSALSYGNTTVAQRAVVATTPAQFREETFAAGGPFEQGERQLVVNTAATTLFERNLSVGDRVTLTLANGTEVGVTVVGVLDDTESPFGGVAAQPQLFLPTDPFYDTSVRVPGTDGLQEVYPLVTVVADSPETVGAVQTRVDGYLRNDSQARRLLPGNYAFQVRTNEELLDQLRELIDTFTAFITGIAFISLLVGSIGIANIMLVSVTERTREVGIMKAVGAQNRDVLQLFLLEAVVLGVVGALLGTLLGFVGGYAAAAYVEIPVVVPWEWIPVAVSVGVVVGVLAGLYPAWRAARTDPVDALRYE